MRIGRETSLTDLAFIVCTALDEAGETAVLTGGSAATVYAPDACQSRDLDFVFSFWSALHAPSAEPLHKLGFVEAAGIYRHHDTSFTVEFPMGPLAVGGEEIKEWSTLRRSGEVLHILTPTDCIRDRLAWFLFNKDYSSLEQALAVARCQPFDLERVHQWCIAEGEPVRFQLFSDRLTSSGWGSEEP